jgi:hypothetical protein
VVQIDERPNNSPKGIDPCKATPRQLRDLDALRRNHERLITRFSTAAISQSCRG